MTIVGSDERLYERVPEEYYWFRISSESIEEKFKCAAFNPFKSTGPYFTSKPYNSAKDILSAINDLLNIGFLNVEIFRRKDNEKLMSYTAAGITYEFLKGIAEGKIEPNYKRVQLRAQELNSRANTDV